jgi:hypothetical protein
VEWMNRGRRTDRVVYVLKEWDLPKPLPGAEWQLDAKFNLADAHLRDPEFMARCEAKDARRSAWGMRSAIPRNGD